MENYIKELESRLEELRSISRCRPLESFEMEELKCIKKILAIHE